MAGGRGRLGLALALGAGLLSLNVPPALALSKHVFSASFGGAGTNALSEPVAVAVDDSGGPSQGDVYVADPAAHRVEKFSPAGQFILMFGRGVDKTKAQAGAPQAEQDVCTAASGDECQAGDAATGVEAGAFAAPLYLAVDNSGGPAAGDVYVGDDIRLPGATPAYAADVQKFDPQGNLVSSWGQGGLLDGSTDPDTVRFASGGGTENMVGVAVDSAGRLFVASNRHYFVFAEDGTHIADFQPEGLQKGSNFPYGASLAVDSADNLYLVNSGNGLLGDAIVALAPFQKPPHDPTEELGSVLGNPILGFKEELVGLGIDSSDRDLYVTLASGQVQHYAGSCTAGEERCPPLETFGAGHLAKPRGIAVDEATGTVYVADSGDRRVAAFAPTPSLPGASARATPHTPSSESLAGHLDPAGAGAVQGCRFQYVAEPEAFANARQSVTLAGASGGSFTLTATTVTFTGALQSGAKVIAPWRWLRPLFIGRNPAEEIMFRPGDALSGPAIPPGATITSEVRGGSGEVHISAAATEAGVFTFAASETTAPIPYNASAAEVRQALEALKGIGAGNVEVTGSAGGPYTVEFKGLFAGEEVPQLRGGGSELTPSGATVAPATLSEGGAWSNAATVPCAEGQTFASPADVSAEAGGLQYGTEYRYRLIAENAAGAAMSYAQTFETLPHEPLLGAESISSVQSDGALVHDQVTPGGGDATYHTDYQVEYVTQAQFEASGFEGAASTPSADAGSARTAGPVSVRLSRLAPDTTYHYRLVAHNASGTARGAGAAFTTLPAAIAADDTCPNAHVRQQTGAAGLLDCRAYELVSAANAGGYDVASDVVAGQSYPGGYPRADGRVLYGVVGGAIPGSGSPTGHATDPYLARRSETGWSTGYVGVPATDPSATGSFSSPLLAADTALSTFAFGGAGLCSPCFADGSSGIPLRLPSGELVQGMSGPISEPEARPDGDIAAPLSADGEHLVFGTTAKLAEGGNEGGDVSIYDRNLRSGETHVVSNSPESEDFPVPLPCLQGAGHCNAAHGDSNGIASLAVSADGSRVLLAQKVSEDADHNAYWHLYMDVGDAVKTIDLTPGVIAKPGGPGFAEGVLFAGMSEDGSKVFFTTKDKLLPEDEDESADLYVAEVNPEGATATLRLVSTGEAGPSNSNSCNPVANKNGEHWNALGSTANCGSLAIGGGGGVAGQAGAIYFLSPELLAGSEEPQDGTKNAPNLYLASPGQPPRFIATLEPESPLVLDALSAAGARRSADFQVTPSGGFAAFASTLPLAGPGEETAGHVEIYRYDASTGKLACASCTLSGAPAEGDSSLAPAGLSLSEDGRVFFDSTDRLAATDTDGRTDVYEWSPPGTGSCSAQSPAFDRAAGACIALISAGTSPFDSRLLSATANGTDVYFFTRDSLAPQDRNGPTVKIYDARVEGGFPYTLPAKQCQASDECRGPSGQAPAVPGVGSLAGSPGNAQPERRCRKGYVLKHGRCAKKHRRKHARRHRKRGGRK